jgi:hypothetical protein
VGPASPELFRGVRPKDAHVFDWDDFPSWASLAVNLVRLVEGRWRKPAACQCRCQHDKG